MHAGDIMNAPPIHSTPPLERARPLTVLADREWIAQELNDHVIQRIFAVGLDLQGTIARSRSSEITARLNRSVTDLQTVIEDIRTTVVELQRHRHTADRLTTQLLFESNDGRFPAPSRRRVDLPS